MRSLIAALFLVGLSVPGALAALGDDIVRTCEAEWFLPREVCTCVAEDAVGRFNELQLRWLAMPAGDPAQAFELSKAMSYSEGQAVTSFISSAPHQCGAE